MNPEQLVASWLERGRAGLSNDDHSPIVFSARQAPALVEKIRQAYDWIANNAIFCPFDDVEFGPPMSIGAGASRVALHSSDSYASFILMPLLTLMTRRRLLFVGAPGRGKTTMATLMSMLTGESLRTARRSIQHGHPQLTIADLLGSPLPSELIRAEDASAIKVSWRGWIRRPVKIIDEYNRIPTKTQSALLSLMADGYAEMYEQVIECGRSAWFLTANDDQGGGTFPVIEALKDRIDVVVRCTPFHARFLEQLVERIEADRTPEEFVPRDIVFSPEEIDQIDVAVRAIEVPGAVQDAMGFLIGQLDFCRRASNALAYMNKDTLHLAGRKVGHVCTEDCPLDKNENLCTQTENGVSARAYQTLIHYAKALAYFRGNSAVSEEDIRQLIPWVLHERLTPNRHSAFFQKAEHQVFAVDKIGWIRQLFDRAMAQHAAYAATRRPVLALQDEFEQGLEGLTTSDIRQRMATVQRQMEEITKKSELNGPIYEDLVLLKNLYYGYQTRLRLSGRGNNSNKTNRG